MTDALTMTYSDDVTACTRHDADVTTSGRSASSVISPVISIRVGKTSYYTPLASNPANPSPTSAPTPVSKCEKHHATANLFVILHLYRKR
ncbi:hypothetical protein J6590_010231 [Homalodisca vitripennis]|nr:hypothetical protein J6590_010231 [Homalodisca vitripennis]